MKIAIQGNKGSFHSQAAVDLFGDGIELSEKDIFRQVFEAVEEEEVPLGLVAIENTIYGSILTNYDLLLKYRHQIVGEIKMHINHNLMALPSTNFSDIKEVRSQSIALEQCRDFLSEFPDIKIVETNDTANAAKTISEDKLENVAAIASAQAADIYNLEILAEEIEDNKQNYTRFIAISKEGHYEEKDNKSSIMVELKNEAGSLAGLVNLFDKYAINMTKLESRPIIGRPWNYRFYIDYEIERLSEVSWDLMEEMERYCENVVNLGSYPKSD